MQAGLNAFMVQAMCQDCLTGIAAAGTTQGTATVITNAVNFLSTVVSGSGIVLPSTATAGDCVFIYNGGANAVKVYPDSGAKINGLATNAGVLIGTNTSVEFWRGSSTQWAAVLSA